jgi:sialidase-1
LRDGRLVGLGARFYRDDPNQGLTNRANMGFVPMDLILLTSSDDGRAWFGPTRIETPLVGPAFEICHAVVELEDGRWLAPTQTWPDWHGRAPNGMKAIALVSHDQGRTWPESIDVMDGSDRGIIHFEQSLIQLNDGRLAAIAWAYDVKTKETLPNPYVISNDGLHFGESHGTGLHGQTAKLLTLHDGRILCVYRRHDKPGLWANLSVLEGDTWTNQSDLLLWNGARTGSGEENTSDMLSALSFGYPSLVQLPDRDVLVVFWCEEDKVQVVRWFRLVIAQTESSRHDD